MLAMHSFFLNDFAVFMLTGNKITLHTRPNARGIDIREELLKFYDNNYSAGLMCLTVYGKGIYLLLSPLYDRQLDVLPMRKINIPLVVIIIIYKPCLFAESVTKLETLVREKFSLTKNNSVEVPGFPGQPCSPEHLKVRIFTYVTLVLVHF